MIFDINNPWLVGIFSRAVGAVLAGIILYYLFKYRKQKISVVDIFTDEDLTDNNEHKSSTVDVKGILHKTVGIKLTSTGTISDYFVVMKLQSADENVDASYRTFIEGEFEDDEEQKFTVDDAGRYFRITVKSEETASATNYITCNAKLETIGKAIKVM